MSQALVEQPRVPIPSRVLLQRWLQRAAPFLAVLGTCLFGLAAWLAWPRMRTALSPVQPGLRAVLVDLSASVTRLRPGYRSWLRGRLLELARETEQRGEELLVVTYAVDAKQSFGPGKAHDFADMLLGRAQQEWHAEVGRGGDLGSRLGQALALVRGPLLQDGRASAALEIFSDGRASDGDIRARCLALAREGISLKLHELPLMEAADLNLERLIMPPEIAAGEPLLLACDLSLRGRAPAGSGALDFVLEVRRAEAHEPALYQSVHSLPLDLVPTPGGDLRWRTLVDCGVLPSGLHPLEARVHLLDELQAGVDPIPENNNATAIVRVGGTLLCGLVMSPEQELHWPKAWTLGSSQGLQWLKLRPDQLGAALEHLDAMVSFDLGPAALPGAQLQSFVRRGGCWLACGGWRALSGGGLVQDLSSAEAAGLLPFLSAEEDGGERDVILLIDGSGSMEGEPFRQVTEAVRELALAASPRDSLALYFFTGTLGALALASERGASAEERLQQAASLLQVQVPGGSTDILYSLGELLANHKLSSPRGLLLLLTDGKTSSPDAERARLLRARLSQRSIDLRIIAMGKQVDQEFLRHLLLSGEELSFQTEGVQLGSLLAQQIHADRVSSAAGRGIVFAAHTAGAAQILSELQDSWRGVDFGQSGIEQVERVRVAPSAELLWQTSLGEPLLALQPVGLGYVAACASALLPDWGSALRAQPLGLELLLRRCSSRRAPASELHCEWRAGDLWVSGVPAHWPLELAAELYVRSNQGTGTAPRRSLGRLQFYPPPQIPGWSTSGLRRAQRPASLALPVAGSALELEWVLPAGEGPQITLCGLPRPLELEQSAPLLPPGWSVAGDARPRPRPAPHPWAAPVLGLALICFFISALYGSTPRQAFLGADRH